MVRRIVIPFVAFVSLAYGSPAAQQNSTKPVGVTQILKGMSANIAGISSFQVPVHIVVYGKKGIFSRRFTFEGSRYFKKPDRNMLKVTNSANPEIQKGLVNAYALIDSPVTWAQTHNITLQGTGDVDGHHTYALFATRKQPSNLDHLILDVDMTTFDPVRARWFLKNGGTLTMHMRQSVVDGKYRLAKHDDVAFATPAYHGTVDIDYGTYAINVPVADSVFVK